MCSHGTLRDKYFNQSIEDRPSGKRKASSGSPAPIKEEVLKERKHEYGNLDPQELLQKLNQEGIQGAKLQHSPTSTSIHLQDEDTLIQIGDNSTHIFCNGDQKIRRRLRTIIMQCLKRF